MKLPEKWEPIDPTAPYWEQGDSPTGDFRQAFEQAQFLNANLGGQAENFNLDVVEAIHESHVSYHGEVWSPEHETSTEMTMVLLIELKDGRWATLNAWNDYTGWGCQDDSTIRVSPTRDHAIQYGLDNEGRDLLGLKLDGGQRAA